ncbi:MAG: Zn-ribbon domain-containing OB-fold protein [Candidatus Syntropharchaeia archaeon]
MSYIPIPMYLSEIDQRYRLVGKKCKKCEKINFPPRKVCKFCGSLEFEDYKLSGNGEIYSYTIIQARGGTPTEFREQHTMSGNYGVAIIQLDEGPRVVAQLTDCDPEKIEIGMKVKATVRRIYEQERIVRYGYKFRPT